MPANLENSAVATGLENVSFHSNHKQRKCQRMLISHASKKQCSKFSKPGFNSTWTMNFQMFKLDLEKVEKPEIKLPTSVGSLKRQESSRKTSISALLTMPKPLCGSQQTGKFLKEMGIPDHMTCLLRNLHADQEATVRTGHGTTDWFQIGKRVRQRLHIVTLFI